MEITEEELQRRMAAGPKPRIAGPDDPIYSSGLTMTCVHGLPRSIETFPSDIFGDEPDSAPDETRPEE